MTWNADLEYTIPAKLRKPVTNPHQLVAARPAARATTKAIAKATRRLLKDCQGPMLHPKKWFYV
jgi:hypothetical protein